MRAKICGVGVGPGDPELITRRAERIIRTADVIAFPGKNAESSTAFQIAAAAIPEIRDKELLALDMPMTRNAEMLNQAHRRAAEALMQCADQEKQVVYLILGDCTIYSSFTYLDRILREEGYETEWINGIPSFCAAAARVRVSLAEGEEVLRILPGPAPETAAGNTVILKAGRHGKEIRELPGAKRGSVITAENVGMPTERILFGREEIPDEMGYFSMVLIRDTPEDIR